MTFEEIGNIFKQERERRGLSIKEVMEVTKISRRNLIAIEEGKSDDLPHPVYAKGFIRSYARFLGLDGEEMARVFESDQTEASDDIDIAQYDVTPGTDLAFQEAESPGAGKKSSLPAIMVIMVLLAILGGLGYYFGFYGKVVDGQSAAVSTQDDQAAVQPSEAPPGASLDAGGTDDAVQEQEVADEGGSATAGDGPSQQGQEGGAEDAVATQPEAEAEPTVLEDSEEQVSQEGIYQHTLVIRATTAEGCWVGVWKGENRDMARDFFLRKGEPLRLMFNSFRRIRIGNVPGVTITYNGNPYPMDADKGKTQDLRFGDS